jgi:CubicO group peptidase (beta-lactamase class C family)
VKYGLGNAASGATVSPEIVFPVMSVIKSFTATAIMQLQEQNQLNAQDEVSTFFPDFPNADQITLH